MSRSHDQMLDDLIGDIYSASIERGIWSSIVNAIRERCGGALSALFYRDSAIETKTFILLGAHGYDDTDLARYATHFAARDVRARTIAALRPNDIYLDDDQIDFRTIVNSEIVNDFFRPLGASKAMGANLFSDPERYCVLSVHRSILGDQFGIDHVATFRRIVPHVRRSLQVQRQLAHREQLSRSLAHALDHLQVGVFILNGACKIAYHNTAAGRMLATTGFPLRIRNGVLGSAVPAYDDRIGGDVASCAKSAVEPLDVPPPIRRLRSTAGSDRMISVMTARLPRADLDVTGGQGSFALMFVSDTAASVHADAQRIRDEFRVTTAEAEIISGLLQGLTLNDISSARNVSHETTKVQLKSIFRKTETRSQTSLIRIISKGLWLLGSH